MQRLHPSMKRLYKVAYEKLGDEIPAQVARRMNASPQVISNWERRGISEHGAIEAERAYGASPLWILEG